MTMITTHGFNTTKTANGFRADVSEHTGFYNSKGEWICTHCIIKTAHFTTRARATGYAKRWTLYFRRLTDRAA